MFIGTLFIWCTTRSRYKHLHRYIVGQTMQCNPNVESNDKYTNKLFQILHKETLQSTTTIELHISLTNAWQWPRTHTIVLRKPLYVHPRLFFYFFNKKIAQMATRSQPKFPKLMYMNTPRSCYDNTHPIVPNHSWFEVWRWLEYGSLCSLLIPSSF